MRLRVNILCICAFVAAMAAVMYPWMVRTHYFSLPPYAPPSVYTTYGFDIFEGAAVLESVAFTLCVIGVWLFIVGVGLSLWTPLSGFVMFGGIAAYLVGGYWEFFTERTAENSYEVEPGIGVAIGAVAAALALASFVRPVFIGSRLDGGDERESRFLAWTVERSPPVEAPAEQ
jgi:hypothetical protein